MSLNVQQFILTEKLSIDEARSSLSRIFPQIQADPLQQVARTYYDTFDWLLFQAGSALEQEIVDGFSWLRWFAKDDSQHYFRLQSENVPRFPSEFPDGTYQQQLSSITNVRAVLPQIHSSLQRQKFRYLNQEGKTTIRLTLESIAVQRCKNKQEFHALPLRLQIIKVRGYEKAYTKVIQQIEKETALSAQATQESVFEEALRELEIIPQKYSSKLHFSFTPTTRMGEATQRIFLHLLETIKLNEDGTKKDIDSEFLHDFRVAIRRTRSAITQIKNVYCKEKLERFREDFSWLGQITSTTRDLDVYLLKFRSNQHRLSQRMQSDLAPLVQFLQKEQKDAQAQLVRNLESVRYQQLIKDWEKFLLQETESTEASSNVNLSTKEVADRQIWRVYQRILKEGGKIDDSSPPESLHDLRKTCKKLRYLMEFFQSVYAKEKCKPLIQILKSLQENLGDFQDYEVQSLSLRGFAERMFTDQEVTTSTLLAMGALVRELEEQQHQARLEFAQRFANFAQTENQNRFKDLFDPTPR